MERILKIDVKITGCTDVKGSRGSVCMIEFTGTAEGERFNGSTVGTGVDTQKTDSAGVTMLSARYMLEGTDSDGCGCRIFVENNSDGKGGFVPVIVTDSKALADWENTPLKAEITPSEGGVTVEIFKL